MKFFLALFLAIGLPLLVFGQANPSYNSFVGSNGITINVSGVGNQKKIAIGGSSTVTNGFLVGTTGQLGKFINTNIVGDSGLTIGAATNISGFGGTTDIVSIASHSLTFNGIPLVNSAGRIPVSNGSIFTNSPFAVVNADNVRITKSGSSETFTVGISSGGHGQFIAGTGSDLYFGVNNNGSGDLSLIGGGGTIFLAPIVSNRVSLGSSLSPFTNLFLTGARYQDDGINLLRNGVPIGGSQTITTNLTVVNASIFEGDTTFQGVNDFSGTSNIFNGPVYFNSNFVFQGTVISNIAQVNSANYMPVSTGSNFVDSQFVIRSDGHTYLTNALSALESKLYFMRSNDATSLLVIGSAPGSGRIDVPNGALSISSAAGNSLSLGEGTDRVNLLTGAFYPNTSNTLSLGTATLPWSSLYVSTGSVHFIGPGINSKLHADSTTLYLNGVPVGGGDSLWSSNNNTVFLPTFSAPVIRLTNSSYHAAFSAGGISVGIKAGEEFQLYSDNPVLYTIHQGFPAFVLDPQNDNGYGRYLFSSADDLSGTNHTVWQDQTNHVLMTLHGDGSLSVGAQTNRLSSDGTNPLWDGVPIGGGPWTDNGLGTISALSGTITVDTNSFVNLTGTSPEIILNPQPFIYLDATAHALNMVDTNNTGSPGSIFVVQPKIADGSTPYVNDTTVYHTGGVLHQWSNFGTNVTTIGAAGGIMSGKSTLDYYGPFHGNEALLSFSLSDHGEDTKYAAIGSADSASGNVYSVVEVSTATNNADVQISSYPAGIAANANGFHFSAKDATSIMEGLSNGVPTFTFDALAGTLSLSSQTNLIGMNGSGQLTVDGVPMGGQTPWISDIDGAQFKLTNVNEVRAYSVYLVQGDAEVGLSSDSSAPVFYMSTPDSNFAVDFEPAIASGTTPFLLYADKIHSGTLLEVGMTNLVTHKLGVRDGGAQISLSDTNGLGNLINIYASTNSGSAVLYTEGSPAAMMIPVAEWEEWHKWRSRIDKKVAKLND